MQNFVLPCLSRGEHVQRMANPFDVSSENRSLERAGTKRVQRNFFFAIQVHRRKEGRIALYRLFVFRLLFAHRGLFAHHEPRITHSVELAKNRSLERTGTKHVQRKNVFVI